MFETSRAWDLCLELRGDSSERGLVQSAKAQGFNSIVGTVFSSPLLSERMRHEIRRVHEDEDLDVVVFTPRHNTTLEMEALLGPAYADLAQLSSGLLCWLVACQWDVPRLLLRPTYSEGRTKAKITTIEGLVNLRLDFLRLITQQMGFTQYEALSHLFSDSVIAHIISEQIRPELVTQLCKENQSALDRDGDFEESLIRRSWPQIWMGFDENFENSMQYAKSPLTDALAPPEATNPPFESVLIYCTRCCLPETAEGLTFDKNGICEPCRSAEQKMQIDWQARQKKLQGILLNYSNINDYEILVPISGGKDSTFQLHVLTKKYSKKVLAATFSHNWYSPIGRHNLALCLRSFNVDHIMMFPRRAVVNQVARKSLSEIGDSCWHCHAGVGAFPLQVAVAFKVSLLIWGESVAERDGRATYEAPIAFTRNYFERISARIPASAMTDKQLSPQDLLPYTLPGEAEYLREAVMGIHLGDYMFWDDERQMEFVRDTYGWQEGYVEGTYKRYKSVECLMAGVHDYSKYLKRGFGRTSDHASQDVRAGLITRGEGFALISKLDSIKPTSLAYYSSITGLSEQEIQAILVEKREGTASKLPRD